MRLKTNPTTEKEKVGVLLVHGIGETKKFENLENAATNIARSLLLENSNSSNSFDLKVIINSSDDGAYGANQQTWLTNDNNLGAVVIEIKEHDPNNKGQAKKITELVFRETWWADLGKSKSLKSKISFWIWGLSLWSQKQFMGKFKHKHDITKFGTLEQMHLPTTIQERVPSIKAFDRWQFFVVSWVILLILFIASFLDFIIRRVSGSKLHLEVFSQYLGDIQSYQQQKREENTAGYLIDINQPMRVSIRRRMIKELVKMGLGDYDRWYVLAHSLGTVIAFNGLMEPDAALPNYINQDLWELCKNKKQSKDPQSPLRIRTKGTTKLTEEQADTMFPTRPSWLDLDDVIAREDLFKNLKGFMTYGSPLSKFAVFWPAIVPINNDNSVFSKDFQWINIYDPTDPVADRTKYFDLQDYGGKKIIEIPYKACSIHLDSHIRYLTHNQRRENPLVKQVANWLFKGGQFQVVSKKALGWPNEHGIVVKIYESIRYLIWLIFGLLCSWMLSYFTPQSLLSSIKNIILLRSTPDFSLYFFGSAIIVFLFGVFARLLTGDNFRGN